MTSYGGGAYYGQRNIQRAGLMEMEPMLPLPQPPGPVKVETSEGMCSQRCKTISCAVATPFLVLLLYLLVEVLVYVFAHQRFQPWVLQYPDSIIARVFLPPIEIMDSIYVGRTDTFLPARTSMGNNFVAAGMVWLSSFSNVATTLTNPQARTYQLGEHPLYYPNLPDVESSRLVFLLSLSDREAGGSGAHEAFRSAFIQTLIETPEAKQRQNDDIAASLLDRLVLDYNELPHDNMSTPFFSDGSRGLIPFVVHYLHYVMFGIDIYDATILKTLEDFLVGPMAIGHYFYPHGLLMPQHEVIEKVVDVYLASPAFQKFEEYRPEFFSMTKRELATLAASIMRIAGVQGTHQASSIVLGAFRMPEYPGVPERFDQRTVWDQLDLSDTEEIQQYIMECLRLDSPVSVTHHVATAPFSINMQGGTYSYPAGTKIAVPIGLANLDPVFWGEDVYRFNLKRPNLKANLLSFHSRGSENAGRICPGKALVMATLTEMVARLGNARRGL